MEKLHVTLLDDERTTLINNATDDVDENLDLLYNKLAAMCQLEHYIRMDMIQQLFHIEEMGYGEMIEPVRNKELHVDWNELSLDEIPRDNLFNVHFMVAGRRDTLQLQRSADNVYVRYILHLGPREIYTIKWTEDNEEKTRTIEMEDCDVLAFSPRDKIMINSNPCQQIGNRCTLRPSDYQRVNYVLDMYSDQTNEEIIDELLITMNNELPDVEDVIEEPSES